VARSVGVGRCVVRGIYTGIDSTSGPVREYLQLLAKTQRFPRLGGLCPAQWLLDNGREFQRGPRPKGVRRRAAKACYRNALELALHSGGRLRRTRKIVSHEPEACIILDTASSPERSKSALKTSASRRPLSFPHFGFALSRLALSETISASQLSLRFLHTTAGSLARSARHHFSARAVGSALYLATPGGVMVPLYEPQV
jgi:hypothetical protein